MSEKKRFLEAGKIVNTHGVRGEVRIEPWCDSPAFLKKFKVLYIDSQPKKVISARVHKQAVIAAFEGVEDVNAAMCLKNKVVYIDRNDAKLEKGAFFIQDIMGFDVIDEKLGKIGTLTDVLERPAGLIYVVSGETEHLIPAVDEFIKKTDLDGEIIYVSLIEGM